MQRARLLRSAAGALLALVASGALSCRRSTTDPQPTFSVPPVEFSGCDTVLAGPVCELAPGKTVTLWVRASEDAAIEADFGPTDGAIVRTRVQDGWQLKARPTTVPNQVSLTLRTSAGSGRWTLRVAPVSTAASLVEAERLRQAGKFDEARALIAEPLASTDAATRAQALGKAARLDLAAGKSESALQLFREAIALDVATGRVSDEVTNRTAAAYSVLYSERRSFEDARSLLVPIEQRRETFPAAGAIGPYYLGLLAEETADYRTALRAFRESIAAAERTGDETEYQNALQELSLILATLGRRADAEQTLKRVVDALPNGERPCKRAEILTNLGWLATLARTGARPISDETIDALQRASELYAGPCPKPMKLANTLTNMALAELFRGRIKEAERARSQAASVVTKPEPVLAMTWLEIDGTIALARDRLFDALQTFTKLERLAARLHLPDWRWRGALGCAQTLDKLGREADAVAAFDRAEAMLDEQALFVPLGEGREHFFDHHDQSVQGYVDFLLRRGRSEQAAGVVRRSRSRHLRLMQWVDRAASLNAKERVRWDAALGEYRNARARADAEAVTAWQKPLGEKAADPSRGEQAHLIALLEQALGVLGQSIQMRASTAPASAPRPGETILLFQQIDGGVVGFAISAKETMALRLGPVDPHAGGAALSDRLLAPFRAALQGATRVRVLTAGALAGVDVHALPWNGRPLVATVSVSYGMDTMPRPRQRQDGRLAIIVADPRGDLPKARAEAHLVSARLETAGWRVDDLIGVEASRAGIQERLEDPNVDLLHYAGHGVFAGLDGWGSSLPLGNGVAVTIGDIVTLSHVPRTIVLSGCDTALIDTTVAAGGLGLAQAFLVAGADAVIAATRPVADDSASRVIAELYQSDVASDPAGALREATTRLATSAPEVDWASFRALEH